VGLAIVNPQIISGLALLTCVDTMAGNWYCQNHSLKNRHQCLSMVSSNSLTNCTGFVICLWPARGSLTDCSNGMPAAKVQNAG
jgi:hypothetical protein